MKNDALIITELYSAASIYKHLVTMKGDVTEWGTRAMATIFSRKEAARIIRKLRPYGKFVAVPA